MKMYSGIAICLFLHQCVGIHVPFDAEDMTVMSMSKEEVAAEDAGCWDKCNASNTNTYSNICSKIGFKGRCRGCQCSWLASCSSNNDYPARCRSPSPPPPAPPPPSFKFDSEANTTPFDIAEIKLAAKMATNVYWTGKRDKRYGDKILGNVGFDGEGDYFDMSIPYCWSKDTATYYGETETNPYLDPDDLNRTDCKDDDLDGWVYQGRIRKDVDNKWWIEGAGSSTIWGRDRVINIEKGHADADIYFKTVEGVGEVCYVAIAGTDDNEDWMSNIGAANREWLYENDDGTTKTFKVSKGFNRYYKTLQQYIKDACKAPTIAGGPNVTRTTWVTGHSLGSAASDIMHAHGDAVQSITFGSPKAFENVGFNMGNGDLIGHFASRCNAQSDRNARTDDKGNQVGIHGNSNKTDKSINIYTHRYATRDKIDFVASVPQWGEHCADHVYELYQKNDDSCWLNGKWCSSYSYGLTLKNAASPANGLTGTIRFDGAQIHPMQAGYLKYLYNGCYAGLNADGECPTYESVLAAAAAAVS